MASTVVAAVVDANGKVAESVSPTLIVVLIIVVWLIVLAPLLLRGQRPISKAGEAFDDTRVVYEGGSELPATRRQPKLSAADVRRNDDEDSDYEVVEAEAADDLDEDDLQGEDDLLIEEPTAKAEAEVVDGEVVPDARGSSAASVVMDLDDEGERDDEDEGALSDEEDNESEDVEVAEVIDVDASKATGVVTPTIAEIDTSEAAEAARGGSYNVDESYTDPSDFLHPSARADAASAAAARVAEQEDLTTAVDHEDAADTADSASLADEELSEEEMEFARRRSGRGGWDPDRETQAKVDRYARRQRTLLGLGIVVVLTVIIALIFGSWWWLAPALSLVLTGVYLAALRTQVRQERELRARRIQHLRRARLGVRQSGQTPRRHHPGGVVLDIEDDHPDFEYLDVAEPGWSNQPPQETTQPARRPFRRVG